MNKNIKYKGWHFEWVKFNKIITDKNGNIKSEIKTPKGIFFVNIPCKIVDESIEYLSKAYNFIELRNEIIFQMIEGNAWNQYIEFSSKNMEV